MIGTVIESSWRSAFCTSSSNQIVAEISHEVVVVDEGMSSIARLTVVDEPGARSLIV